MSSIKLVYRNEMRLLCRNLFMAIPLISIALCWGYIILTYENESIHYEEIAAVFYNNFQWIMMVNLLLVGLYAVYVAGKDRDSEFELLVVTYKVRNTEWVLGKWLVAQTYGLCFAMMTLLIQGIWFLNGSLSMGERYTNLVYLFVQMEGAFFIIISFGFLLGILIRNMLSYICLTALLGAVFLLQANSYGFAYVNPRLNLLTPYDSMYIATPYTTIWGINGVFEGAVLHQLVVVLTGAIVILAAILLFHPHRRLRMERNGAVALVLALMIPVVIVGGIRYTQYNSALEQYLLMGQQYSLSQEAYSINAIHGERPHYAFSMDRTRLNIRLSSDNRIGVDSELAITYNGDVAANDVSLTLHRQFKVTDCSSTAGITCSRDDDYIHIHLQEGMKPHAQLDLKLSYEGDVRQYRSDGLLQQAFVEHDRIYLPKEAGWYPLIGERQLAASTYGGPDETYAKFEVRNGALLEDQPTEFAVTIKRDGDSVPMALTIPREPDGSYKGTSQYGLSLIGGNLEEDVVGPTRIVSHPEVMEGARNTAGIYMDYWNYIESWLGIPMAPDVIYVMNDDHSRLTESTPSQQFIAWSFYAIKYVDSAVMVYALANELIHGNPSFGEDVHVLQRAITWGLMKHARMETEYERFGDWYAAMEGSSEAPAGSAERIAGMNRYDELGEEQFKQMVKYLYNKYEGHKDKAEFNLLAELERYEGE
ncbi:ABC transporter permease [Paenibacillus oenotherae]|uniref:ABC transporter permease n=1 Tax=Paenibacillus oenotherae TaxID=1435645 RepID=A0ABS7D4C3_9BACL|nr:ABC transporter permease [Paenibacillus oenotherae]MBW7474787.1 ABC transporter permease [Paenibacillus oenotherae]